MSGDRTTTPRRAPGRSKARAASATSPSPASRPSHHPWPAAARRRRRHRRRSRHRRSRPQRPRPRPRRRRPGRPPPRRRPHRHRGDASIADGCHGRPTTVWPSRSSCWRWCCRRWSAPAAPWRSALGEGGGEPLGVDRGRGRCREPVGAQPGLPAHGGTGLVVGQQSRHGRRHLGRLEAVEHEARSHRARPPRSTPPTGTVTIGHPAMSASMATPGMHSVSLVSSARSTPPNTDSASSRCPRNVTASATPRRSAWASRSGRSAPRPRHHQMRPAPRAPEHEQGPPAPGRPASGAPGARRTRSTASARGHRPRRGGGPAATARSRSRKRSGLRKFGMTHTGPRNPKRRSSTSWSSVSATPASKRRATIPHQRRRTGSHTLSGNPRIRCHTNNGRRRLTARAATCAGQPPWASTTSTGSCSEQATAGATPATPARAAPPARNDPGAPDPAPGRHPAPAPAPPPDSGDPTGQARRPARAPPTPSPADGCGKRRGGCGSELGAQNAAPAGRSRSDAWAAETLSRRSATGGRRS